MESKSFIQTLQSKSTLFKHATTLEDVLCLTVLEAGKDGEYFNVNTVDEARELWLKNFKGDCLKCPFHTHCIACIINE